MAAAPRYARSSRHRPKKEKAEEKKDAGSSMDGEKLVGLLLRYDQVVRRVDPHRRLPVQPLYSLSQVRAMPLRPLTGLHVLLPHGGWGPPCLSSEDAVAAHIAEEPLLGELLRAGEGHIVAAGGFVYSACEPERRTAHDIDIFFYGTTPDIATRILEKAIAGIAQRSSVIIIRTRNAVTIKTRGEGRTIQFILRIYERPEHVIAGFDLQCCSALYSLERGVQFTAAGAFANRYGLNLLDPTRRSLNYEHRIAKYLERRCGVVVPLLGQRSRFQHMFATDAKFRALVLEHVREHRGANEEKLDAAELLKHISDGLLQILADKCSEDGEKKKIPRRRRRYRADAAVKLVVRLKNLDLYSDSAQRGISTFPGCRIYVPRRAPPRLAAEADQDYSVDPAQWSAKKTSYSSDGRWDSRKARRIANLQAMLRDRPDLIAVRYDSPDELFDPHFITESLFPSVEEVTEYFGRECELRLAKLGGWGTGEIVAALARARDAEHARALAALAVLRPAEFTGAIAWATVNPGGQGKLLTGSVAAGRQALPEEDLYGDAPHLSFPVSFKGTLGAIRAHIGVDSAFQLIPDAVMDIIEDWLAHFSVAHLPRVLGLA